MIININGQVTQFIQIWSEQSTLLFLRAINEFLTLDNKVTFATHDQDKVNSGNLSTRLLFPLLSWSLDL